ncbi:MAG TPA: hypothetical protein VIT44_06240 [Cyclobacteriaceae bacterium]
MKKPNEDFRTEIKTLFKQGDLVHERIHPTQKLIVRGYVDGLYYCEAQEAPQRKKLVFFERELVAETRERALVTHNEPAKKKDKLLKEIPSAQMKVS